MNKFLVSIPIACLKSNAKLRLAILFSIVLCAACQALHTLVQFESGQEKLRLPLKISLLE